MMMIGDDDCWLDDEDRDDDFDDVGPDEHGGSSGKAGAPEDQSRTALYA